MPLAALAAAALLLSVPATGGANEPGAGQPRAENGTPSHPAPLGRGAGYGRQEGSRSVAALQRSLREHGHDPGPIDGLFGPRTEAAVERFQRARNLAIDGIAGPRTAAALRDPPRRGGGAEPIRELQSDLRALGHDPGAIDGLYGPRTKAAVKSFQRAEGLVVDGVVGPNTGGQLVARHADRPAEPAGPVRLLRDNAPPPLRARMPGAGPEADPPTATFGYVSFLVALAAVLLFALLRVLRSRRRRGPHQSPARATAGRPNLGLVGAALLGAFAVGAASGAVFATQAGPDEGLEQTAEPLRTSELEIDLAREAVPAEELQR